MSDTNLDELQERQYRQFTSYVMPHCVGYDDSELSEDEKKIIQDLCNNEHTIILVAKLLRAARSKSIDSYE